MLRATILMLNAEHVLLIDQVNCFSRLIANTFYNIPPPDTAAHSDTAMQWNLLLNHIVLSTLLDTVNSAWHIICLNHSWNTCISPS